MSTPNIIDDNYTRSVLEIRYNSYHTSYIATDEVIKQTGLPIRHQNPPEDVTENIVKFIIINYDKDASCKWAKAIKCHGDLCSDKYDIETPPEVKAFTSNGPCWKVSVSSDSPEWHNIKMNKTQTLKDQCEKGIRPHISWENIYSQIPDKCVKVYDGTFEGIFIQQATEPVAEQ